MATTASTGTSPTAARRGPSFRGRPLSRGELALVAVVMLALLHHVDHVLRADNSGWPFTPDVTPFTISLVVYPIFVADFLWLRDRRWLRVGMIVVLFAAVQVTHLLVEPPADQYGTWANGVSAVPHAAGQPNLLETAAPALGVASVAASTLLSAAVLIALLLLVREAREAPAAPPHRRTRAGRAAHRSRRRNAGPAA